MGCRNLPEAFHTFASCFALTVLLIPNGTTVLDLATKYISISSISEHAYISH